LGPRARGLGPTQLGKPFVRTEISTDIPNGTTKTVEKKRVPRGWSPGKIVTNKTKRLKKGKSPLARVAKKIQDGKKNNKARNTRRVTWRGHQKG